jgi:hypothetical protein
MMTYLRWIGCSWFIPYVDSYWINSHIHALNLQILLLMSFWLIYRFIQNYDLFPCLFIWLKWRIHLPHKNHWMFSIHTCIWYILRDIESNCKKSHGPIMYHTWMMAFNSLNQRWGCFHHKKKKSKLMQVLEITQDYVKFMNHYEITLFLFAWLFSSRTSIFSAIWRLSPFMAFNNEVSFYVAHLLQHGTSFYMISSEGPVPTSHSGIRPTT